MHKVLTVQNDLGKMANNEIRNKFFDLLYQFINNEVAEDYKKSILENSLYRYAVDNNARINFLNTLKEYDTLPHWNPYSVKGVIYQNGNVELMESEINELINEYRVNLSNNEFENELDKDKPPGLQSCNRLIMAVNDCLEIQIINEMIRDLKHPNRNLNPSKNDIKPFRTIERFNQFKAYIEKHINLHPTSEKNISQSYTELSFLFQMLLKNDFIEHTTQLNFVDWMFQKDFINKDLYSHVFVKNQLKSLVKSSPKSKTPLFNNVFELDK